MAESSTMAQNRNPRRDDDSLDLYGLEARGEHLPLPSFQTRSSDLVVPVRAVDACESPRL